MTPEQNENSPPVPASAEVFADGSERTPFFQKTDWLSFGVTVLVTLSVYLWTISPEVTLDMGGVLSTAGSYGGVAHPPGFPVWTWYAWLFTKLLPFSNIAWRVSVSSAVAAAMTCGTIALMVSRGALLVLEGMPRFERLEQKQELLVRLCAGIAAGTVFGFGGSYWITALTPDTLTLTTALLSAGICLLFRWSYSSNRTKYLDAAFFVLGLSGGANPVVVPAALALPFFVMFVDEGIGRELFYASALLAGCIVLSGKLDFAFLNLGSVGTEPIYFGIGVLCGAFWIALIIKTRRVFTKTPQAIIAGMCAIIALGSYFYLPVASMTTPPSNWGYARSVEGFVHLITRGQFERLNPTNDLSGFTNQIGMYFRITGKEFGWPALLPAITPFFFLRRMGTKERRLMLGLGSFFACTSLLMMILLNPPPDRQAVELVSRYFTPSHLILAIWSGFGLVLFATIYCRPRSEPDLSETLVIPHS